MKMQTKTSTTNFNSLIKGRIESNFQGGTRGCTTFSRGGGHVNILYPAGYFFNILNGGGQMGSTEVKSQSDSLLMKLLPLFFSEMQAPLQVTFQMLSFSGPHLWQRGSRNNEMKS